MRRQSILFIILLLPILNACSLADSQFANSRYGNEITTMMDKCIEMQEAGLLSGVPAGQIASIEFMSDEIDFSERDNVHYPLNLNCIVIESGQQYPFAFSKATPDAGWQLVK